MLLLDILHMLLVENEVVVCKFNPVLDYLGPYAEYALLQHSMLLGDSLARTTWMSSSRMLKSWIQSVQPVFN